MKTNNKTQTIRVAGALLTGALTCGILLLASGCQEEESVFERRYVLMMIPGFEIEDHVALLDHKEPNLRYLALANLLDAGALGEPDHDQEATGGPGDLRIKLRDLLEDPAPKVRAIASYAPINRFGAGAEERLVARLDDPHAAVRIEALASLGIKREPRVELSPAATDQVTRLLADGNVLVRLQALDTLGSTCSSERAGAVVRRITSRLRKREPPEMLKALEVLGRIDAAEAETFLLGRLDDDDERIVRVAVSGLVETKSEALEEWILDSLQGARGPENFLIATLAKVATARSRAAAISRLVHPDSGIRSECRRSLVRIGGRESLDALAGALDAMIPAMETVLASPSIEPAPEVEEFIATLNDITGLGENLGIYRFDREGMETLLQSTRPHEQLVAMARLHDEGFFDGAFLDDQFTGAQLFERLKTLAADRSPVTRAMAFEALGGSIQEEAGEILLAGANDPVFQVRLRALEALIAHSEITGRRTLLRAIYDRRDEFAPETYAEDEPALILRERIEQAARQFEPSWNSEQRAEHELREGRTEVVRLLASSFLVPREAAVKALLDALATGSNGEKTYALRSVADHLQRSHLDQLRNITSKETNPERKQVLAELIADLGEPSE